MSHVPHDLHDAFPQDGELLRTLKGKDDHFQKLAERYHILNRDIHRIESDIEPSSDEHLEDLKKQRLALLDTVAESLARARAA